MVWVLSITLLTRALARVNPNGFIIVLLLLKVCLQIKPRIDVYRAKFSEITHNSIMRACSNLARPDQLTSFAVDVRMELDLRIGAAFTRFQTLRLQKRFPQVLSDQLISYGSCQFPTLGFVVQRYREIRSFIAETFFKIKVVHVTSEGEVEFAWRRIRVFDQLACTVLYQVCLENPWATVVNQSSKPKSKWRPLPMDTVELEKLASRKLKITAKEAMKIAEKLYNRGYISYPRTETNIFPSSMNLNDLIQLQTCDQNWGEFAANLLVDGAHPRQGTKTDNAHPPIHPTKHTSDLDGNEKRLYELIVRHFLACCSKDAQGIETVVEIDIAGEGFSVKGLAITAKNYLNVYPYDKWSDKTLPVYHTGDTFLPTSIDMEESETQPPSLLTEADLIGLMEKHGIGTDATHAEHIETIKNRTYVGVQPDGTFVPSELGMGLVEGYDTMGLEMSKPHLRAELESDLKKICLGQKDKDIVLGEQIQKYQEIFVQTYDHAIQLDEALAHYFGQPEQLNEDPIAAQVVYSNPVFSCPLCKSHSFCIRKRREEKFMMGCTNYPQCTASAFFPSFVLNAQVSRRICSLCVPQPVHKIKFQFKRGSVPPMMDLDYTGCVKCDEMLRGILDFRIRSAGSSGTVVGNQREASHPNRQAPSRNSSTRHLPRDSGYSSFPPNEATQDSANPVVCSCGTAATEMTVRKQGLNTGRQFFTCPNKTCDFFLWADGTGHTSTSSAQTSGSAANSNSGKRTFTDSNRNQQVCCNCRQPAVVQTVKKAGPNQGKQFYCCGKHQGQSCNFFEWVNSARPQNSNVPPNGEAPIRRAPRCCSICRQPGHTRNKCPRK